MNQEKTAAAVIVIGLSLLCLTTTPATTAGESPTVPPQYGVEVTFDVSTESGTYTCTALVSDLSTDEVVTAPRVSSRLGEEAVTRSGTHRGESSVEIKMTFYADAANANYTLEVTHGTELVTKQKSSIKL